MKTNNPGKLYPPRRVGSRLAALLATLLLLLAPASALADKGYIVKLSNDGKTLTYTYDEEPTADDANCWTLNQWIAGKGTYLLSTTNKSSVETVVFDDSFAGARPTSTHRWFSDMTKLATIVNLKNLNTSEVTDMSWMFSYCESLKSIDLSGFNTAKVENMANLFSDCVNLSSISFGDDFNTANVTDMSSMFDYCKYLKGLDLRGFNTGKVTNMKRMFYNCQYSLSSLDLSSFNTTIVTDMSKMFGDCRALKTLNISSFNTANVTNMEQMFAKCQKLESLDLSGFNTTNVTKINQMFGGCNKLASLNLGNNDFKGIKESNVFYINETFGSIFDGCALTVGTGFDVSVLGDETSGKYTWRDGTFSLQQLIFDEDNTDEFAAAGNQDGGITYPKVVLKRSFNSGVWNTLVVPFGITAEEAKAQFGDDVKIAKYTNVENTDGKYTLHFATITAIEAHQPVFIYGVTKDGPYTFTSKTVKTGTPEAGDDKLKFVGTYVAGNVTQGDYFIDTNNTLWLATGNTNTIKATRATFRPVVTSGAKTATFVIDGETTAINLPATIGTADGAAYNLQGQRVGDDYKGVVIQNGRKYVRK